jgi:dynein heavy chain
MCCLLLTAQVAKELRKLCVKFHEDVQRLSAEFLAQQRRHYYVTPTSYLELLSSYKKLLAKKQDEVCCVLSCLCPCDGWEAFHT